jgi:endonuclease YncB( thermonuclease family)
MSSRSGGDDDVVSRLNAVSPWDVPRFDLSGLRIPARVIDVYDADTITVVIPVSITVDDGRDGGLSAEPIRSMRKISVRFIGIDADEMRGGSDDERKAAVDARDALIRMFIDKNGHKACTMLDLVTRHTRRRLLEDRPCLVDLECEGFDKYGRLLARVKARCDGCDYGLELLQQGLVKPYV